MILAYNFLMSLLAVIFMPMLVLLIIIKKKYRGRTLERLGLMTRQIQKRLPKKPFTTQTVWIHALSVGEVTSALPLVRAIRQQNPKYIVIFTVATRSGKQVADKLIASFADSIFYSPFDFWFSVKKYINAIQPDLFILVETDFWPNWLWQLHNKQIPVMLVNGRISEKSFTAYKRFRFFFAPMFNCFSLFSMQTAVDSSKLVDFGIAPEKILTLGNLKYDIESVIHKGLQPDRQNLGINDQADIFICGSTHSEEEKILFHTFAQLKKQFDLFLVLAPRDISRGKELVELAASFGLQTQTRSGRTTGCDVLILDTIGELASCYQLAKIAFVGGSLVPKGGHNPIEPAVYGVPVLFGPHMEDFAEIASDLLESGGAKQVTQTTITKIAADILANKETQQSMAESGRKLVSQHRGIMTRHIRAIDQLLNRSG